jgi:hypothetical protein
VPHLVIIFLYLILGVFILSAILDLLNAGITAEILVPASPEVVEANYVEGRSTRPGWLYRSGPTST